MIFVLHEVFEFSYIFNGIFTHQKLVCSLFCQPSLLVDCCMHQVKIHQVILTAPMLRENGANWKNSYAICSYKEGKKPIPKNKKTEYLNKKNQNIF